MKKFKALNRATHSVLLDIQSNLRSDYQLRAELAEEKRKRQRAEAELIVLVGKVERPADMPLHYDGCPCHGKREPDEDDECTCGEAHLGTYWKSAWMLERHARVKADIVAEEEHRLASAMRADIDGLGADLESERSHVRCLQQQLEECQTTSDRTIKALTEQIANLLSGQAKREE